MSGLKLFGLLGSSLVHSYSEFFFNTKFKKLGLNNYVYKNFEIQSIEEFPEIIKLFPELVGLNVTNPFKEDILKFVDVLELEAKKVGAVNTLLLKKFDNKTIIKGYNTDIYGFEILLLMVVKDFSQKTLVLGTGGAAKSVKYVLDKLEIESSFVSRKKQPISKYFYQDLSKRIIQEHKIIINCSPLGTYPNVNYCPQIPYEHLTKEHILIDLVYNPQVTKFLQYGLVHGATVINGLEMLYSQAEKSWEIFQS